MTVKSMSSKNMEIYKPDWLEAKERMTTWWSGEKTDRIPAHISCIRSDCTFEKSIGTIPDRWIEPKAIFHNLDINLKRTFWGAEAFPLHEVYMGPMFLCSYFGCEPVFDKKTTWYKSSFNGWQDAGKINFKLENNKWWKLKRDITRISAERSEGRYLTAVSGVSAAYDLFAELFGNEETMIAMMEDPEKIIELRDKVIETGKNTYDELYDILAPYQDGSIDGMLTWGPGRVRTVQCDMCVMISPQMFDDFVLDEIKAFMEHVDYGIYHLDGEEQIKHLDSLVTIDALKMIQYVPVSKSTDEIPRDPLKWTELFTKIQEAGKKVWIICPYQQVEKLIAKISTAGVFLFITGCPDVKTAEGIISCLDKAGVV
jgi:hypothetical protein